jgi:RecB family endonuclease NucS
MAKNTNKKIKELKKDKPSKITNEELNRVQSIVNDMNRAQLEIGSFESKKHNILHHISILQEQLGIMQSEFEKTYGTSDINIQDGTINHDKNEQAN